MSKYLVTGKMVIHIPFEMEVEADGIVEAEEKAVSRQRDIINTTMNLTCTKRPIGIRVWEETNEEME